MTLCRPNQITNAWHCLQLLWNGCVYLWEGGGEGLDPSLNNPNKQTNLVLTFHPLTFSPLLRASIFNGEVLAHSVIFVFFQNPSFDHLLFVLTQQNVDRQTWWLKTVADQPSGASVSQDEKISSLSTIMIIPGVMPTLLPSPSMSWLSSRRTKQSMSSRYSLLLSWYLSSI